MAQSVLAETLTVAEAAERLSCSERTVRRLIALQAIPCIRLGYRTLRISRQELEDYIGNTGRRKERHIKGGEWLNRAYRPSELSTAYAKVTDQIRRREDEVLNCCLQFYTKRKKAYFVEVLAYPDHTNSE
jgi:excisionase family DNA binding protein